MKIETIIEFMKKTIADSVTKYSSIWKEKYLSIKVTKLAEPVKFFYMHYWPNDNIGLTIAYKCYNIEFIILFNPFLDVKDYGHIAYDIEHALLKFRLEHRLYKQSMNQTRVESELKMLIKEHGFDYVRKLLHCIRNIKYLHIDELIRNALSYSIEDEDVEATAFLLEIQKEYKNDAMPEYDMTL